MDRVKNCEIQLEGRGPWAVEENGDLDEMMLIHTSGHTAGSTTLYHKPSKSTFAGVNTVKLSQVLIVFSTEVSFGY